METNRYRIILSSKSFYKEVEIAPDIQTIRIGTGIENDVRLNKEYFFKEFDLIFTKKDNWALICSDNLYISVGDARKLLTKEMSHGDSVSICYQDSGIELFNVELLIDFDYEKKQYDLAIDLSKQSEIRIGGSNDCNVVVKDDYIGTDSISIAKTGNGYAVTDRNSRYGVRVNGIKISEPTALTENDFIFFAAFGMCLKGNLLYCDSRKVQKINSVNSKSVAPDSNELKYPKFNRNPRFKSVLPDDDIEILNPPAEPQKPAGNVVMQLMPAIIMLAVTIVLRGIMGRSSGPYIWISVISMGIGIVTSTVSIITARKKYKADTAERIEKYTAYIANKEAYIAECRNNEANLLNDTFYSIEREKGFVKNFSDDLFDRTPSDEDYLVVRLGNGKKNAVKKLSIKQKDELNCTDELMDIPEELQEKYRDVYNVPITLDLKTNNAVGVVGSRDDLYSFIKTLTTDLAVRQYYTDTKLFYVLDEEDVEYFSWLRMLPHVKNEQLNMRNIVFDSDSRSILFDFLYKELSSRETEKHTQPNYVVMVYRDNGIKNHPISQFLNQANSVGVSFIFFEEHKELLPSGCNSVIQLEGTKGIVTDTSDKTKAARFDYEVVNTKEAAYISNKLAPVYCEEVSLEGSLTKNITLFELMNILNVEDINLRKNWAESEVYNSMAAPLGVKSKSQVVSLDLNEKHHGPHGLVAGTTGSGKSEILQSYILSMATLYHPYEVGFVIIDFKGGGMVNQFKNLPHLIGAITNIDGKEIDRSLSSIKAELRKRQALFAEYDVNHIDAYIKLYKKGVATTPLPHLILIVDEFAELKMDQPEFMKELISAARIGRSLGVHLILATQKPSGVVDAQIWSNSKFKLCLKVQNKEDSNEVLKTPVAAEIKEPGRAYLQVGNNEIFELFQSAYSGAPATFDASAQQKPFTVYSLDLAGKHTPVYTRKNQKSNEESETQLDAIVNYIDEFCKKNNIKRLPDICLPPLGEVIPFPEQQNVSEDTDIIVPIGIYDNPQEQIQDQLTINLTRDNCYLAGSSLSGKTNFMQVIIKALCENYSAADVCIYIVDFASMMLKNFAGLNQVGGVVTLSEETKFVQLLEMLSGVIDERKQILSEKGLSSFSAYREAGLTDLKQIVLMIENYSMLSAVYQEYEGMVDSICRDGVAVGVCVIATNPMSAGLGMKRMTYFGEKISLYQNDTTQYSMLLEHCKLSPDNIPGRGIVSRDNTIREFQTYLAFDAEKEVERVGKIQEFVHRINEKNKGIVAMAIPTIPEHVDETYIVNQYNQGVAEFESYAVPFGIRYEDIKPEFVNLTKNNFLSISGQNELGRAKFIEYLLKHLHMHSGKSPVELYIVDDVSRELEFAREWPITKGYTTNQAEVEAMIKTVFEEAKARYSIMTQSADALEDKPLLLMIFNSSLTEDIIGISQASLQMHELLVSKLKGSKVCIMHSNANNVAINFKSSAVAKLITEYSNLLIFEEPKAIKLVSTPSALAKAGGKKMEYGDAYYIKNGAFMKMRTTQSTLEKENENE